MKKYIYIMSLLALMYAGSNPVYAESVQKMVPKIVVEANASVEASPDIAEITFSVRRDAPTVKEATRSVTSDMNTVLQALYKAGIDKKDTKLTSNGFSPQYDYIQCITTPCESQKLRGYQAYRTILLKVRNLDAVPDITALLSSYSISDLNGPTFKVENEVKIRTQARREAIKQARAKAREIAVDLGVRLVRIVSFTEQNDYMYPVMYAMDSAKVAGAPEAPMLPEGKNSYTSRVTVEYEIR